MDGLDEVKKAMAANRREQLEQAMVKSEKDIKELKALHNEVTQFKSNGMATGTTLGWLNGLPSFVRVYLEYGIEQTSVETTILPYGGRGAFSAEGDSGAIILGRDGRLVALLTGHGVLSGGDGCNLWNIFLVA